MTEDKPQAVGTTTIIPLALPKGTEKLCELCQTRAHLQCSKCRVTFYCNPDHQQVDWVGIHGRICELLVPIRTSTLFTRAAHIEVQLKKEELIEICRSVAQSKLSEGKPREALPAAQFCLRCYIDVHGPSTVKMVPAYLLLAEANIGLGNLGLVAELLSEAEWVVMKSPECCHAVRHMLHRSLGRLHMANENLEEALHHFANDIYFASEAYGLDSTVTAGGFFLLADVFAQWRKMPVARSLYSDVARIWHRHLTILTRTHLEGVQDSDVLSELSIDKARRVEVDKMLRSILEFRQSDFKKDSAQIALVAHCLAMLWFLGEDSQKALDFCNTALEASQQIPNQALTETIQGLLQKVQRLQTDPQAHVKHVHLETK